MGTRKVQISRQVSATAEAVWQRLCSFDLTWHPDVVQCDLLRSANGSLVRNFSDQNGKTYSEERTYASDSDRVLRYRLTSGIEGVFRYEARVSVSEVSGGSDIMWRVEIDASDDRLDEICVGTKSIFETACDALAHATTCDETPAALSASKVPLHRKSVAQNPTLACLTNFEHISSKSTLVLFLHGIGGCAENWRAQLEGLGGNFAAVALDLRGYGNSEGGSGPTKVEDYCQDIVQMVDALGSEKLVLVGLSYGAWIANSFAMRHGDRLAGLVLAGGATGMSEASSAERNAFLQARMSPLEKGLGPANFAADVVDAIAGPNATANQREALAVSLAAVPAETYRDALECFSNPEETFDFSRVTCPVLLVTGSEDRLAPPDEIRAVSERMVNAPPAGSLTRDVRFEVIEGAGHVCNHEGSEVFNAHLTQFLKRLPGVARDYKPSSVEKQQKKRSLIAAAAHAEFCKNGYDGTSMDRLAEAAGVSKPTLYQYFGDKETLFMSVLDIVGQHLTTPLVSPEGTLVERLWRFSWTYADFVLRPDILSLARLILGEAARRPQSAVAYHRAGPGQAFAGIVRFVNEAVLAGDLEVDDAELAANDLWSLILSGPRDHYLHHVTATPDPEYLRRSIGHGLKVFLSVYSTNRQRDLRELEETLSQRNDMRLS